MKRNKKIRIVIIIVGVVVFIGALLALRAYVLITGQIRNYQTYWVELAKENEGASVRYFALGDSSAQGVGASEPSKGYVGLLADTINQTFPNVRTVNLSVSGAKVEDILRSQIPQLQAFNPGQNDIITLGIGSNNIRAFDETSFSNDMKELLNALPKRTIVADVPYFGGGRARSGESNANRASDIIRELADAQGMRVATLEEITTKNNSLKNYSYDFFHPSNRAYELWAQAFLPHVRSDINTISDRL